MRRVGLVLGIAFLVGACGAQELAFDALDGGGPGGGSDGGSDGASTRTGCSSDGDCRVTGLHCDALSHLCVECVSFDQCTEPGRHVCDSTTNQCVECGVNGDCRNGVCELTTRRCVPSCADGGLCPDYFNCNQRSMCVDCTNDADCANARSGPVCDTLVGQCVQCVTDTQCWNDRPLCNRTTGHCVECVTSQSCYSGEVCDPSAHVCVDNSGGSRSEGGAYTPPDSSTDAPRR